ncbi:hypothetical protein NW817_11385 [Synechococcus sp. H65.1]|uniref:hypothetical protein n=1 Tax=Synechococcus sp. H65.1 TaxID=2964525 RepID=UPI0039C1EF1E
MQSKDRFDQIDFRLDRPLAESVIFIKDDLSYLMKGIVQQQVLMTQEQTAWLGELKAVCQHQAETARRQAETVDRLIAHLLSAQDPRS